VALLWFTRRQRAGKILVTCGFGLLMLFSYYPVANALLGTLERDHQALYPRQRVESVTARAGRNPRWIVVLGGGHADEPTLPPTTQLTAPALARLIEGVRLQRELPGSKLVLSGATGRTNHARVMAAAAALLGVPPSDMVVDTTAWDTAEEARSLSARMGSQDFVLVTSALHMPRALGLFRRLGKNPLPAPADHLGLDSPGVGIGDFFPTSGALMRAHAGIHEYLGMLWSRLRGQM
jgi:uncharacterized SAM-binding protein YcdF (DUF218 family)